MLENIFSSLSLLFSDHTVRIVFLGSCILGIASGCLGTFAVLRQQSLLGDAIAHATLPGVGIAFLLTQSKSPLILLIGAAISGWLGSVLIKAITDHTRIKKDAALGIILSVFFGFGLVMLTIVQKLPAATKAGLDKFLFGNAATLLASDITTMIWLASIILVFLAIFYKEFKIIVFDSDYAQSLGMNIRAIDIILTTLIVITIVLGLQLVGVVLMSAMLVAPAAAARQWTDKLSTMITVSAIFGAISGVSGSLLSSTIPHLPTGPTIVVFLSTFVLISLFLAPHRGLLWDWLRTRRQRKQIHTTSMLKNLLLFSEISTNPFHPHDIAALQAIGRGALQRTMLELERKGWARQTEGKWALTPTGLTEAKRMTEEYEERLP